MVRDTLWFSPTVESESVGGGVCVRRCRCGWVRACVRACARAVKDFLTAVSVIRVCCVKYVVA